MNPSAQTGNERGTVSIVYSDSGSAGRIVRQAGIRNRQKSQTGRDQRVGRIGGRSGYESRESTVKHETIWQGMFGRKGLI